MEVAFYRGRKRLFNRLTSWWLCGPYSHTEAVLGYDEAGQAVCASSSMMDGGVRVKHMHLNPEHWDLIEVGGDTEQAWDWLRAHQGAGYDYLALLGFVFRRFGHSDSRFLCSEAVAEMLGFSDAWRFDPCSLHAALLSGSASNDNQLAGNYT